MSSGSGSKGIQTRTPANPTSVNRSTNAATRAATTTTPLATTATGTTSPYTYTYGRGTSARNYKAYGYGRGSRNRSSGRGRGYGRSQGNNRAIVSRLRSVQSSLARIDHDYQGHRVRAMHAISMAIRQLSNRSSVYRNTGFGANGMNNALAMGNRRGAGNGANGAKGKQRLPQARSDARMGQALRTTQGINMQLTSQGMNTGSGGHARARGHVQRAIHEMSTALAIR